MPTSLDADLTLYVRETVRAWLEADPDRSASQLAQKARCSRAQVSAIVGGRAGVGNRTALKLGSVFGWTRLGDLERAADAWYEQTGTERPSSRPAVAGLPRLRDRPEWPEVVASARRITSPDAIGPEVWTRIGGFVDSEEWPRPLTSRLIEDYAVALDRALRRSSTT